MSCPLPPSASVATPQDGDKLHAPAAARNAQALADFLSAHAPPAGQALEIASGTGQHVVAFARGLPGLHWHPTDVDKARLRSIDAHVADTDLKNVAHASYLDATAPGWGEGHTPKDLIVLINLLHLIPAPATQTLINEAAGALTSTGTLMLYGPFRRDGALTSDGDTRFDAELRGADPAIGYKDTRALQDWLHAAGLSNVTRHDMPANNLMFLARKV